MGGAGNGGAGELGGPVFARRYAHAGMVRLGGEKMSKSLGNLVFVSKLTAAEERLATWRAAVSRAEPGPASSRAADEVLTAIRERIADDLDAPGALAAVDDWAGAVLVSDDGGGGGRLVRDAVDAILGIAL